MAKKRSNGVGTEAAREAHRTAHALTPAGVALYMRVSSEDQADHGTIDAQRDFLRKFASLYQLPVADEYADDGVTGTLPLGERPEDRRRSQILVEGDAFPNLGETRFALPQLDLGGAQEARADG